MRVLLDTHVILWWLMDDPRLGTVAHARLTSGGSSVAASVASLWEVSIKYRLGKLNANAAQVAARLAETEINVIPIRLAHLTATEQLPLIHRDPFDRMLIAQSLTETMQIMSADAIIAQYGVPFVDAAL
jgi:PIN domain nuclease of toxin-antitoxin system